MFEAITPLASNKKAAELGAIHEKSDEKEVARLEVIGTTCPWSLSRKEFHEQASLFHGARNPDFRVEERYDYQSEFINDTTLGDGLYVTEDELLAENYAKGRPDGSVWKLMPYRARMFDLTVRERMANLSFPRDLFNEWIDFALPKIIARIQSPETKAPAQQRLIDVLGRINNVVTDTDPERFIDLRTDILDTKHSPYSLVNDEWKEFCSI